MVRSTVGMFGPPFKTGYLPLNYSGDPGVNVSCREGGLQLAHRVAARAHHRLGRTQFVGLDSQTPTPSL
jgi:hypothetical protein